MNDNGPTATEWCLINALSTMIQNKDQILTEQPASTLEAEVQGGMTDTGSVLLHKTIVGGEAGVGTADVTTTTIEGDDNQVMEGLPGPDS